MVARSYPPGRTAASNPKPWFERRGGARFELDDAIVRAHYPGLLWSFDEAGRLARLDGTLTIIEAGGIKTPVASRIRFPCDYPASEPVAYETDHRFEWT